VECNEYQELVSAAVDNRLSKEELEGFTSHVGKCPDCRYEFEIESITKAIVRERVPRAAVPGPVRARIRTSIEQESRVARPYQAGWMAQLWGSRILKPAIGFSVAFIAFVLLVDLSKDEANAADVIQQSFANYHAVVQGDIKPQLVSSRPEVIQAFFSGKTEYPVQVPRLRGCDLIGGLLNEFSGTALAHVVYTNQSNIVYIYEACWRTVQEGKKLQLPPHIKAELQRTGRFVETRSDGHTIVLWTRDDRTLCSAVSLMPKDELLACVDDIEPAVR
jgi:hypothetical protein